MEKEYLGLSLSLSLSFPSNGSPAHLSLLQCSPPSQPSYSFCQQNQSQWHSLLHTNSHSAAGRRKSEENGGPSSPNSSASTASAKRAGRDGEERASLSDDEDGGDGCRKKLRLSKDQSAVLEGSFKEHSTLNLKQKLALAKQLNLRPRQVEVWFQNRRARTKLKQTEVDCELLRRCCHDLSEENRRLQKEVHELRALKLSPQLYMHMTPPTTLTLCPSCERLTTSTPSSRNRPFPEHHHRRPVAAPSAPIPLRPSFLDAPPQRS